jgi:hypothetical protein
VWKAKRQRIASLLLLLLLLLLLTCAKWRSTIHKTTTPQTQTSSSSLCLGLQVYLFVLERGLQRRQVHSTAKLLTDDVLKGAGLCVYGCMGE